jgi:putative addiction module component (TIGR02574 family)
VGIPHDAAEVLKDALALPVEARAALIGPFVDSLDSEVDENVEEAWREEIGRRLQEIDGGTMKLVAPPVRCSSTVLLARGSESRLHFATVLPSRDREETDKEVIAFRHGRRRPGYWLDRL